MGEIGEIEVLGSQTIATCGYCGFMLEVSISIPVDDDDGTKAMHVVFLFSAGIGAIVWMGESNPLSHELQPRHEEMILSYRRHPPQQGGYRASCCVSISSGTSSAIMVSETGPAGEVQEANVVEASQMVRNEIQADRWVISAET
jgi:hypothetical protein